MHALPWLIDPAQVACQEGKTCIHNALYIRDLIHHADVSATPGLIAFADAEKAFDRVQHPFLLRVMQHMRIPATFIDFFRLLLAGATTRIKVNGYLGCYIKLRNGVRQGCPCAALAYLLSIQPLISLLNTCSRAPRLIPLPSPPGQHVPVSLHSMFIPAEDGSPTPAPIVCAMADDLSLALRDTYELPALKLVFDTHERASGGRNNWFKTFLMRIGSLRGSTAMPPDWSPAHANFDEDPIRYLGAFFGTTAAILSRWLQAPDCPKPDDLTSRMRRRLALWSSFGVGPTYAGRNLILKNSVLAMAWYLTEAQTIPSIDSVLTSWQRMAWIFLESSATTLSLTPSMPSAPTAHHVSRAVLIQDYPEGGRRCPSVELFARSLRARTVRYLIEPGSHPFRLLAFHWIRLSYPAFPSHPSHLLLSNFCFTDLHPHVPPFWREVLTSWGSLGCGLQPLPPPPPPADPDGPKPPPPPTPLPQPTYQATRPLPPLTDGLWHRPSARRDGSHASPHLSQLLSMPIPFNPQLAGCLGAPVRDPLPHNLSPLLRDRATAVRVSRPLSEDCLSASHQQLARHTRLSQRGITHLLHLTAHPSSPSELRLLSPAELARTTSTSRTDPLPRWMCEELLASIPPPFKSTIDDALRISRDHPSLSLRDICTLMPFSEGSWVLHRPTGLLARIHKVHAPPLPSPPTYALTDAMAPNPDSRLAPVDPSVPIPSLSGPVPAHLLQLSHVWPTTRLAHSEEQRAFEDRKQTLTPRPHHLALWWPRC